MVVLRLSARHSFALATTVFTVGFAGTGSAALISEVPAGYTPLGFTPGGFTSGSFDVSGAGFAPVTVTGVSGKGKGGKADTLGFSVGGSALFATVPSGDNFKDYRIATSSSPFTVSASGMNSSFGYVVGKSGSSTFSTTPSYAALSFLENGVTTDGYIQGTYDGSTFTLLDYGIISDTAVPEPASLALLATGIAGIAAMRRRRSAS